mgnify:CR=1 FL=1
MSLPKVKTLDDIYKYYEDEHCCVKYQEVEYISIPIWYNVYTVLVGDYDISFLEIKDIGQKFYRCVDHMGNTYDYNDVNQMFKQLDTLIWNTWELVKRKE